MPEVLTQVSGRELDAEVAVRVMGFRWFHCIAATGAERNQLMNADQVATWRSIGWTATEIPSPPPPDEFNDDSDMRRYSSSIEAAMEVVEKMMKLGYRYVMRGNFENNGLHHAAFDHAEWADANPLYQSPVGSSLPEAVCRAALVAIEANQK